MASVADRLRARLLQLRDTEGRPLLEDKAPEELRRGVPFEHRICPYSGSRFQHRLPMNVSALQQLNGHWPEICGGLLRLRELFGEQRSGEPLSLVALHRVVNAARALPFYLTERGSDPVPVDRLPASVAATFKAALGLVRPTFDLSLQIFAGRDESDLVVDAESLFDHFERSEAFIGERNVCAGPNRMIQELLSSLISGERHEPASSLPIDRLLAVTDLAGYRRFANGLTARSYGLALFEVLERAGISDVARALAIEVPGPATSPASVDATLPATGPAWFRRVFDILVRPVAGGDRETTAAGWETHFTAGSPRATEEVARHLAGTAAGRALTADQIDAVAGLVARFARLTIVCNRWLDRVEDELAIGLQRSRADLSAGDPVLVPETLTAVWLREKLDIGVHVHAARVAVEIGPAVVEIVE